MASVNTYTRTAAQKPEGIDINVSSLLPPTRDEILLQLQTHFANRNDPVTDDDISMISERINAAFEDLKDQHYKGMFKYNPEKPSLSINIYNNEYSLFEMERRPADYSILVIDTIKCSNMYFTLTVNQSSKQISLAYVSKECNY